MTEGVSAASAGAAGTDSALYDAVGGMAFFERLVDRFYAGVAGDPVLLRLYPEPDALAGARRRLTLFLAQYWGGPTTYSDERGHPRLRGRHFAFEIGPAERDHWLLRMREAMREVAGERRLPEELVARMDAYFEVAAEAMRNRD
jgi:hemoglobin